MAQQIGNEDEVKSEHELHEYVNRIIKLIDRVGAAEHKALTQELVKIYPAINQKKQK